MSGLVEYASSDDDDSHRTQSYDSPSRNHLDGQSANGGDSLSQSGGALANPQTKHASLPILPGDDVQGQPALGPDISGLTRPSHDTDSRPISPFSTDRMAVRSFTLPQHPNLDIPASPPGSPNLAMEAKVSHFRDLKRQSVHFNAKLASAATLKNPGLLPKLMGSAGLTNTKTQYATSLDLEHWDPQGFPSEVFADEIDRMQKDLLKKKQAERIGSEREFVQAASAANGGGFGKP